MIIFMVAKTTETLKRETHWRIFDGAKWGNSDSSVPPVWLQCDPKESVLRHWGHSGVVVEEEWTNDLHAQKSVNC